MRQRQQAVSLGVWCEETEILVHPAIESLVVSDLGVDRSEIDSKQLHYPPNTLNNLKDLVERATPSDTRNSPLAQNIHIDPK